VALDGKLIETAGTMSGGGNKARRGGMRLAVSTKIVYCKSCQESRH
jgi:chromosome segregation ATPase